MINLDNYLNDGACPQAVAVMALMKCYESKIMEEAWDCYSSRSDADLFVSRYSNSREQGYVFSIRYEHCQRNYAVYKHRSYDKICILVSDVYTIDTPTVNEMWGDKTDVDASFADTEIERCANCIKKDMINFIKTIRKSTDVFVRWR